jgi:protein-disulfide isomerase
MVEPLDERVDHVRGEAGAPVILEYGDYECPYSRQAFRAIERVERELAGPCPLRLPPLPADADPPARARSLGDSRSGGTARSLLGDARAPLSSPEGTRRQGPADVREGDRARTRALRPRSWGPRALAARIARDVDSGEASGLVRGTPTLFIDGVLHQGGYDTETLLDALAR